MEARLEYASIRRNKMKSSVYEIVGPSGSQSYREVESGLDYATARQHASARNHRVADGRGETFRAYKKTAEGDEGWSVSGRSGQAGHKTGC